MAYGLPKVSINKPLGDDPWRAARATATGGVSEAHKAAMDTAGIRNPLDPNGLKAPGPGERPDPRESLNTPLEWDPNTQAAQKAYQSALGQQATVNENLQIDQNQANQARAFQQAQLERLQGLASGQGPSFADLQLQQARQGNIAAAMSLAASARGTNRALAGRQAQMQAGNLNANAAMESAMARIKEQQMAEQALGTAANQTRTSDMDLARAQADLSSRQNLAAAQYRDAMLARQAQGLGNIYASEQQRQAGNRQLDLEMYKAALGQRASEDALRQQAYGNQAQVFGSVASATGTVLAKKP